LHYPAIIDGENSALLAPAALGLYAKLRPGQVHSADGSLALITQLVERYRPWFKLFWLRGDAAFTNPEIYEYCEDRLVNYFIRLPANANLMRLVNPHLKRPVGRPPKSEGQRFSVPGEKLPKTPAGIGQTRVASGRGLSPDSVLWLPTPVSLPARCSRSIMVQGRWKTGSRQARTSCAGTRKAPVV
jgi:hypothetical protein